MREYLSLKDALLDLVIQRGIDIFEEPRILIALVADYVPNLKEEQRLFRKVIRKGMNQIICAAYLNKQYKVIVYASLQSFLEGLELREDQVTFLIQTCDGILSELYEEFSKEVGAEQLLDQGKKYARQMPKNKYLPMAYACFKEAYVKGNYEGGYQQALALLKGRGICRNSEKGVNILSELSVYGYEKADYKLGKMYFTGEGVLKNENRAIECFENAAKRGNIDSQIFLGNYLKSTSLERAYFWYQMAAKSGEPTAQYEVAMALATGAGTTRNIKMAIEWLKKAATSGHIDAQKKLNEIGVSWI